MGAKREYHHPQFTDGKLGMSSLPSTTCRGPAKGSEEADAEMRHPESQQDVFIRKPMSLLKALTYFVSRQTCIMF